MNAAARLATRVKSRAGELGFPLAGIAPADPPPHHEYLLEWLEAGYAGEMLYLARDPARRTDPGRVLPGARSVLVVGAPYLPPKDEERLDGRDRGPGAEVVRGLVSAYARGEDYHRLIETRLAILERELPSLAEAELARAGPGERKAVLPGGGAPLARSYCDHGPVLERPLAARAGLGWIGKNTLLLHRRYGSWFFLGSVLTTLDLPADLEQRDHCGSCRRCLDACPTNAFPVPYVLDARRCISYLTIELRGAIPPELRAPMGTRIFGCDDCQTVCPWTPDPRPGDGAESSDVLFEARPGLAAPDLVACLEMTQPEFDARFGETAITRTRRRGLRRNAAVALGNAGGTEAIPPLVKAAADDEDPLVRSHAAWALGRIAERVGGAGATNARRALECAQEREADPGVREELAAALAIAGPSLASAG